jgi:electron transfer flavoprotein beta subunit
MEIFVCVTRVPDVSEVEIELDRSGRSVVEDDFDFGINEWDNFALECAIRLKEARGGRVTAISVGDEDAEEVLRRGLAMGADAALRLWDPSFASSDSWGIATILHRALARGRCDLVLSGAISADGGHGQVGGFLAGMLDYPFVALATALEIEDRVATVRHEVAGGREQVVDLELPAVISVQTGICEPRYVSIRGIRKVSGAEIPVLGAADLGLDGGPVGEGAARVRLEGLSMPERGAGAEILEGDAESQVAELVARLADRGVL